MISKTTALVAKLYPCSRTNLPYLSEHSTSFVCLQFSDTNPYTCVHTRIRIWHTNWISFAADSRVLCLGRLYVCVGHVYSSWCCVNKLTNVYLSDRHLLALLFQFKQIGFCFHFLPVWTNRILVKCWHKTDKDIISYSVVLYCYLCHIVVLAQVWNTRIDKYFQEPVYWYAKGDF